jgi:hypothetical protein
MLLCPAFMCWTRREGEREKKTQSAPPALQSAHEASSGHGVFFFAKIGSCNSMTLFTSESEQNASHEKKVARVSGAA